MHARTVTYVHNYVNFYVSIQYFLYASHVAYHVPCTVNNHGYCSVIAIYSQIFCTIVIIAQIFSYESDVQKNKGSFWVSNIFIFQDNAEKKCKKHFLNTTWKLSPMTLKLSSNIFKLYTKMLKLSLKMLKHSTKIISANVKTLFKNVKLVLKMLKSNPKMLSLMFIFYLSKSEASISRKAVIKISKNCTWLLVRRKFPVQ